MINNAKHTIPGPWKPLRIEWTTFFILMPIVTLIVNLLLFGERFLSSTSIIAKGGLAVGGVLFICWYLHIVSMHILRLRMPAFRQTVMRISLLAVIHISMMSLAMTLFFYGFDALGFLNYQFNVHQFHKSLFVGLALTVIATTIWEGEYILIKWKESLEEKEKFEQLNLQNEFDTLKSQVNPHFLFNCFNTLSSLISEDPAQAEVFLDELSKVYRYLLSNNENGMSTLKNELRFIESYYSLLKTRHGDAIEIQVEVDRKYENYLLPSLSLQLLVENAVKHNIVSRQHPLTIEVFTLAGNKLAVNNNLQPRLIKAPSNKIGLDNIRAKYELLRQPGFLVMEDMKNFTVVLPLIWNNTPVKKINMVA